MGVREQTRLKQGVNDCDSTFEALNVDFWRDRCNTDHMVERSLARVASARGAPKGTLLRFPLCSPNQAPRFSYAIRSVTGMPGGSSIGRRGLTRLLQRSPSSVWIVTLCSSCHMLTYAATVPVPLPLSERPLEKPWEAKPKPETSWDTAAVEVPLMLAPALEASAMRSRGTLKLTDAVLPLQPDGHPMDATVATAEEVTLSSRHPTPLPPSAKPPPPGSPPTSSSSSSSSSSSLGHLGRRPIVTLARLRRHRIHASSRCGPT